VVRSAVWVATMPQWPSWKLADHSGGRTPCLRTLARGPRPPTDLQLPRLSGSGVDDMYVAKEGLLVFHRCAALLMLLVARR
jgi:hypothetical protein